jgi:hypothetical protein
MRCWTDGCASLPRDLKEVGTAGNGNQGVGPPVSVARGGYAGSRTHEEVSMLELPCPALLPAGADIHKLG